MPPTNDTPQKLRPFLCHGVDLQWQDGRDEAPGDCIFCGREGKFSVNVETGQWRCFACNTGVSGNGKVNSGGNTYSFLRLLHQRSMENTSEREYQALARDRNLLDPETLVAWGICKSITTDEWLIPGYRADGLLMQLYRWVRRPDGKRHEVRATDTITHFMSGVNLYDAKKSKVWVAEGWADGLTLWETLSRVRDEDGELVETSNPKSSFLKDINVLAVPSCASFDPKWAPLLAGKEVTFLYDSDHPRRLCSQCKKSYSIVEHRQCPLCKEKSDRKATTIGSAGYSGTQRACQLLGTVDEPPRSVEYLHWGDDPEREMVGYDPSLKTGYDVRDWLSGSYGEDFDGFLYRGQRLNELLERVRPIPKEWANPAGGGKEGSVELQIKECTQWSTLRTAFQKAMQWGDGMDVALSTMLASIASVRMPDEQLWLLVISPPSTGKTSLCNALGTARKWVYSADHIRGVMSGYRSDKANSQDFGLIPRIKDKTLIMKDGDTFLKIPTLEKVMAELRALYDTNTSSHYLQGAGREYRNVRTTVIICGTDSLHYLDDSELGQRFLTVSIMDQIDDDFEDDICLRAIKRVSSNKGYESNGKAEEQFSKSMIDAMQLSGGYVDYLRKNAARLLEDVVMSEDNEIRCAKLAKFIAYMRARPSKKQKESQGREMSVRLSIQISRLAYCQAIVLNKSEVDEEVMRRVLKVTLDTSKGRTMDICRNLRPYPEEGLEVRTLATLTGQGMEDEKTYLRFIRKIGVVERVESEHKRSMRYVFRITPRFCKLYDYVTSLRKKLVKQ